ncbi:MAG TPA: hypothetical protein VJ867_06685 [Gemmatimonadaceae bacterium]|nr:hypothetical protein [Gemmatimonadaceae bacterium]
MSDESRAKFLSSIAERVRADAVEEIYLFQPLKQGGTESGVAVVALNEGTGENRLAVYTAKYRLTLKGPERGKWEFGIQVEADAPLVTVEKVVAGVQRRSGDAEEPAKLSGEEFRTLLPPPEPA